MLEINNLRKDFNNKTHALKGVSFKVKRGEFISILGPSGSGKTTLLRSINGLEPIENGEVIFNNKKITKENLPDVQRKTGMIFQEFNLVNNLSSINNVLTGLLNSSSKFLSMFYLFTKEQKLEALQSLKTVGLLKKINKDFNITILCNLHQTNLAMEFSDRVIGLSNGSIVFDQKAKYLEKNINKLYS